MRNKTSVIYQQLSMGGATTLNLPRNSVHDAYILRFNIKVATDTGITATVPMQKILESIENISLITDSTRVHYALNGYDLALLNAKIHKAQSNRVIDMPDVSLDGTSAKEVEFCLYLDEGDIIAAAHTNVELSVDFANKITIGTTKVNVTDADCKVTLKETIYSTAELKAVYGENLQRVAEPKVYSITKNCSANSEFHEFLDLPTGTLVRGALITFTATDGSADLPEEVGLMRTVPDRVELGREDWKSHRAVDEIIYQTKFPANVFVYDYTTQWQNNGVGKNGWSYAKGDVQLAAHTAKEMKVRYISLESIVSTDYYSQNVAFSEY